MKNWIKKLFSYRSEQGCCCNTALNEPVIVEWQCICSEYKPTVKVAKLVENAKLPTRKHSTDAGMDFYALEDSSVPQFSTKVLRTGITMEVPKGFSAQAWPKGRNDYKVGAGVIDEAYTGEILIKIINHMSKTLEFKAGDAIAQILLVPVFCPSVEEISINEIHKGREARKNDGIVNQV